MNNDSPFPLFRPSRVCADCAHPSYCQYKDCCMASGFKIFADDSDDDRKEKEMIPCNTCTRPAYCKHKERCTRNFPFAKTDEGVFLVEPTKEDFINASDEVRKATPIDAIFKFWPDAMVELAQHIWEGNKKYNPEHPKIGWKRELSSDHVGSLIRHICYDYVKATTKEAKIKVMRAVAWRALAELQLLTEEKDDEHSSDIQR